MDHLRDNFFKKKIDYVDDTCVRYKIDFCSDNDD